MSATLKTPNYELPYYKGSDATNWVDYNNAVLKIDEVMKENADTGTTQESQITELTTQYQNLSEQQQTMLETLTGNTADLGSLTTRQENLETHMNDVDTQIESLKTEFSGAEGNIQNIETNVTSLQASVSKNSSDIANIQSSVSKNSSDISNIFALTNEHGTDIENLKTTSADLEELTQEDHTSITALNSGLQQLEASTTQKIGRIQTEVTELSGDVAATQADITRNTNDISQLKKSFENVPINVSNYVYADNSVSFEVSSPVLEPNKQFLLAVSAQDTSVSNIFICDILLTDRTPPTTITYANPQIYNKNRALMIPFIYSQGTPRQITLTFYELNGQKKSISSSYIRQILLYRIN